VTPFTTRPGAVSRVAKDSKEKYFLQLFLLDELFDMIAKKTN